MTLKNRTDGDEKSRHETRNDGKICLANENDACIIEEFDKDKKQTETFHETFISLKSLSTSLPEPFAWKTSSLIIRANSTLSPECK